MRQALVIGTLAALALAGCSSPVPDSGAAVAAQPGVAFGDYAAYELERARREAALTGAPGGGYAPAAAPFPAPVPVGAAPLATAPVASLPAAGSSGISATELAAVGIGATVPPVSSAPLGAAATVPGYVGAAPTPATPMPSAVAATAPVPTTPVPAAAPLPTTVAAASTGVGATPLPVAGAAPAWNPEADPLRDHGLEAMPGNAQPILVTAPVTEAVAATGPNIIEYALAAPNSRGQEWYRRFAFSGEGRMQRNCADYRSPDEAQRDFLARGGPDRDARGIDPDGDGFACGWDPAPFRAAVGR